MPNYTSQKPVDEIKSLIEQLSQACQGLEDEELKNKLLPHIDALKEVLPLEADPNDGNKEADEMMNNKEGGGFMEKLMGGPATMEPQNTP